jgi:hypothetical protein
MSLQSFHWHMAELKNGKMKKWQNEKNCEMKTWQNEKIEE